VSHTTHQTPEFAPAALFNLTMDTDAPSSRSKGIGDMEDFDIFYLFFGLLRQSILRVDPKMKTFIII